MAKRHHKPEAALAKSDTCQQRHIKVCRVFYSRARRRPPYQGDPAPPWIQLKDYWLEQVGFTIDTPIRVRGMDGCLVLTAEEKPGEVLYNER